MIVTNTYYPELNIDGVEIQSRKFLKGNLTSGVIEVIEIIGRKKGVFNDKEGRWARGHLYKTDLFSYEQAIDHWKICELPKFNEVTNAVQ